MNHEEVWRILGISPSLDKKSIRKAYATLSRQIHPEEQEEEFLKLKKAYELAMSWAKLMKEKVASSTEEVSKPPVLPEKNKVKEQTASKLFQLFPQVRDFSQDPALEEFYHLYFVVGEDNEHRWRKFFTSSDFLDVFLEEGFLLRICELLGKSNSYNHVFYRYLFLVYQIYPLSESIETVAVDCKGINHLIDLYKILENLILFPKFLSGEDMTFFLGFLDYYQIIYLEKERMILEDANYEKALVHLFQHYHYQQLTDNVESFSWKKSNLFLQKRHFDSLELIASALRKISYDSQKIALIMGAMGVDDVLKSRDTLPSEKIRGYFAPIFLVLGRCYPNYMEKTPVYWQNLNDRLSLLAQQLEQAKHREAQQMSLVNQFFVQKDVLLEALYDPDYMGTFFLQNLLSNSNCALLLTRFLRLVQEHPQIEENFRSFLLERLWQVQEAKQRKEEISHLLSMENHEYLRYYLSANFPHMQKWLLVEYAVQKSWLEEVISSQRSEAEEVEFFGEVFSLYKSRYFWAYYLQGMPVAGKFFHYHQLQALSEEDFWLCLPLAFCSYGDEEDVIEDLVLRFTQLQADFPWEKLAEKIFLQMAEDYSQLKDFLEVKTFSRYGFGDKVAEEYFQFFVTEPQEDFGAYVVLEKLDQGICHSVGRFSTQLPLKDAVYCLSQYLLSMRRYPLAELPSPKSCRLFMPDMRVLPLELWLKGLWEEESFMAEIAWERSKLQFMTHREKLVCMLSAGEELTVLTKKGKWRPFRWESGGMDPMNDLDENFLYVSPMMHFFPGEVVFHNKMTVFQHLHEILYMVAEANEDLKGGPI